MEGTHGYVSELFKGNTRNNILHEIRKGRCIVHEKPVHLEPHFERFDATQPFARSVESVTAVTAKTSSAWHFCKLRLPKAEKIEWTKAENIIKSMSSLKNICSFETSFEKGIATFYLGSAHKGTLDSLSQLFCKEYRGAVTFPCDDPCMNFETEHFFTLACYSYHQKMYFTNSIYEQIYDRCRMQVLFKPVKKSNNWHANIKELQRAEKYLGNSISGKDVSQPLYAVSVRIGCENKESLNTLSSLFGSFIQDGKTLRKINARQYKREDKKVPANLFSKRISFAPGMLLTATELSGFVHVPANLNADFVKGFSVPEELRKGLPLGINTYSEPTTVCRPNDQNYRSQWLLARSRAGKSTAMMHQIVHIAKHESDAAIYLLDCHRTTAQTVISWLPEELIERVIWLDHEDPEYIVKYNPCEENNPALYGARTLDIVSSLEHIFEAESFHRMKHLLGMAVLSLFVLKKNLATIPQLFSDSSEGSLLRKQVIANTNNAALKRFWRNEYPQYPREAFSPILNRLSALFMDDRVLQMFSQNENAFSINEAWNNAKIIIEPLPVTTILANTIGNMRIGECRNTAFPRIKNAEKFRHFYLFCEEFHRYKRSGSDLINSIVNETAKTGLHFCASNQTTQQLSDGLLESVSSMRNILLFGMSTFDAQRMKKHFNGEVSVNDLTSLPVGGCIAKINGHTIDFQGYPPIEGNPDTARKIIEYSRKHYYTPVSKVKTSKPMERELDYF